MEIARGIPDDGQYKQDIIRCWPPSIRGHPTWAMSAQWFPRMAHLLPFFRKRNQNQVVGVRGLRIFSSTIKHSIIYFFFVKIRFL